MARRSSGIGAFLPVMMVGVLIFFGVLFAPMIYGTADEAYNLTENDTYAGDYETATGFLKLGLTWESVMFSMVCIALLVIGLMAFTRKR